MKRLSKKERERRKKISEALKRHHRKKQQEKARRAQAVKEYHKTGKTKRQRNKEVKDKLPPLPKGFGRIDPRPQIQTMLEQAMAEMRGLHGLESDVRHAINADKSVSYEARFSLPKKWDPQIVLTDLVNALHSLPGTWVSIGFRFRPSKLTPEEAQSYDRFRGMTQVQAYTRRNTSRKLAGLEATAEEILSNVRARKGWKAETMFVRVHWTKYGDRPPRSRNLKR